MATAAQIQANRANAKKSSGPKSDEGKAKSRLNALNHGLRAEAVNFVLPQEDPAELEAKIQEWIDDYQPSNSVERDLVTRAARLSWTLDRAERHETALLSKQVRQAMIRAKGERMDKVCEWGRKLFTMTGKQNIPILRVDWSDDPSAFVARLEESPEGARWMLDRWTEIQTLLLANADWTSFDQFKFVRLLGKHPFAAIEDPELNKIFLSWETLAENWGVGFWLKMKDLTPDKDPAFNWGCVWRELGPRPESPAAAVTFLLHVIQREIDRLQDLVVELEEIEGTDALTLAEEASFCASDAGERLRRFQTARTRELLRTIELLAKLKKAEAQASKSAKKPPKEPNPPAVPKPAARPSGDGSDPIEAILPKETMDYLHKILFGAEPPSDRPKKSASKPNSEPTEAPIEVPARPSVEGSDSGGSSRSEPAARSKNSAAASRRTPDRSMECGSLLPL